MKFNVILLLVISMAACKDRQNQAISTLPAFDIMLLDDSSIMKSVEIPEGQPSIFLYFQTDCPHCQKETKLLLQHIDLLRNVQLFFLTPMSLNELGEFAQKFHLNEYKNIVVGTDYKHSFARKFHPNLVPYITVYDKKKKLVKIYKGDVEINDIVKAIHV